MRHTFTGISHAQANCYDCGWQTFSYKNALANAARHHDAYGHTVHVEQVLSVTYTSDANYGPARRTSTSGGTE